MCCIYWICRINITIIKGHITIRISYGIAGTKDQRSIRILSCVSYTNNRVSYTIKRHYCLSTGCNGIQRTYNSCHSTLETARRRFNFSTCTGSYRTNPLGSVVIFIAKL